MSNLYLQHHGILGQKWGKRNGPPYPLGYDKHSAAEKRQNPRSQIDGKSELSKKTRKGLTEKQKAMIARGAIACGLVLAAYGGYKTGAFQKLADLSSGYKPIDIDEYWKTFEVPIVKRTRISTVDVPRTEINRVDFFGNDYGGVTNPKGYKNNCKDVSEATIKRWLGVDPGAIAGEKTVTGNLHDFIEKRGYNKGGVTWISSETGGIDPDPSGDSTGRVTRQILRKFKEGDCGIIGITWNPKYLKAGQPEDGHAFNWFISEGKVIFIDDQPEPPITNASKYLSRVQYEPDKDGRLPQIEIVKITKDAFVK